jgi:hypothetical protein
MFAPPVANDTGVDSRLYQAKHGDRCGNQAVTGGDDVRRCRSLESWANLLNLRIGGRDFRVKIWVAQTSRIGKRAVSRCGFDAHRHGFCKSSMKSMTGAGLTPLPPH